MKRINRRNMVKSTLVGGLALGLQGLTAEQSSPAQAAGPNSDVRLGLIGLGVG